MDLALAFGHIFLIGLASGWLIFDLIRALKTGRASIRHGAVKRTHQPLRFWCYVCAEMFVLLFCLAMIWLVLSSPLEATRVGS